MAEKCFLSGLDIGKGQLTKEHVVPKSRVPAYIATSPFNIQPAIKIFNNMKADMFLCEWEDKKIELCYTALEKWNLKRGDRSCIIKALEMFERGKNQRNPCRYCLLSVCQEYCFAMKELAAYRERWLSQISRGAGR